jgi:C-terminal binding protein
MRAKVVVTDYVTSELSEGPILAPHADLVFAGARDERELVERHSDADAFLVFHDIQITATSLSRLPRLRGVVRCGVGFDNVDVRAAGELGIVVCNVPDYGTEDVADHALMMLLAVARRLTALDGAVRRGEWDATLIYGAPRMRGRTLGILGCGRIGTATALRGKALGMDVVIYDPYQPAGYEKGIGVRRAYDFEEFLKQSELLSVHTPLTSETRGMLNARTLGLLPKGAFVVNTARGACIDGAALMDAIEAGRIAGAALDVVEREPLDDERMRRDGRVLLTPHAAFYSVEGFVEMRTKAAQEIVRMLTGQAVRNPVNRAWLVSPRCALPPRPTDSFLE